MVKSTTISELGRGISLLKTYHRRRKIASGFTMYLFNRQKKTKTFTDQSVTIKMVHLFVLGESNKSNTRNVP